MGTKRKMKGRPKASSVGGVSVGDVFYASWGYDQTNIDFVRVEKVSPTGKTVMAMSQKVARSTRGADYVAPDKPHGQSFQLKVRSSDSLVGSYPFARGSTRFGYFHKWEKKPIYQTAMGWGH